MNKKIIITGATGLIGRELARRLIERDDEVYILSRSPKRAEVLVPRAEEYVSWEPTNDGLERFISGADAVIHLAGENVMARRWSEDHKQKVKTSRVESTRALVNAIDNVDKKPAVFICASATGYYGTSEDKLFDENSPAGYDFLADVTSEWENEAAKVKDSGIRYVGIRTGIVLSKYGGALARMLTPFKYFVGGPLGNGTQWFPWIHINDIVRLYIYALDNSNVSGILNGVAPQNVTMKEFCKVLGKAMRRPSVFNVPEFALRLLFGEGAGVLVKGAKVNPKRTLEAGFRFEFESVDEALRNLIA